MKKIPKIFKPNIEHQINNNRNVYYSFIEDKVDSYSEDYTEDPIDTLNRLIKENAYIFNKKVLIKTKNKDYLTKIAGKMGEVVITIDGDSININDITQIVEK